MTRKKAAARGRKGPRKGSRAALSLNSPLELLALEFYGVMRGALTTYGLSSAQQRTLFDQTERSGTVKRVSGELLDQFRRLGDLLSTWLEEMPYVDSTGKPKVLPIEGRGATFQSLAKQFLPDTPLAEVVALACRTANVGTLPGGRIWLYGDTFVNFSRTPESALAETVLHTRQIIDTCLHNVRRAPEDATLPRLERIVNHVISAGAFEKFQRTIDTQVHDLCETADRQLKSCAKRGTRNGKGRGAAGLGIYVYFDGSMKHVRNDRKK